MKDSDPITRFAYAVGLKSGDTVTIKSEAEILATLDPDGTLDGLPFMPEMLALCGKRFRVYKRADKTCDTINYNGGRRMVAAVHLEEVRCNGAAHDGCEAACLTFWKEAWLSKVRSGIDERPLISRLIERVVPKRQTFREGTRQCSRNHVEMAAYQAEAERNSDNPAYACQATALLKATRPLPWWDLRQYGREIASGNATVARALSVLALVLYRQLVKLGVGYRALISFYDGFQRLRGGTPYPYRDGRCEKPSNERLNLEPGEWVEIKSQQEILATLNKRNRNRGLWFDAEMVRYCGKRFKVLKRVNKILDEKTGRMIRLSSDCIVLDGVVCVSDYSSCRQFCSRSIYAYWREVWLRRVDLAAERG